MSWIYGALFHSKIFIKVRIFKIFINDKPFMTKEREMVGSEFLSLFGITSGRYCLFLVEKNRRVEIELHEKVKIKNGLQFLIIRND